MNNELELYKLIEDMRETRYLMKYCLTNDEIRYRIKHSAKHVINLNSDDDFDDAKSIESNLKYKLKHRFCFAKEVDEYGEEVEVQHIEDLVEPSEKEEEEYGDEEGEAEQEEYDDEEKES